MQCEKEKEKEEKRRIFQSRRGKRDSSGGNNLEDVRLERKAEMENWKTMHTGPGLASNYQISIGIRAEFQLPFIYSREPATKLSSRTKRVTFDVQRHFTRENRR